MENHLIINSKQQNQFLIAKYIKPLLFHICFPLRPRQPSLPDKAPEVPDCDHLFLEKGGGGRPRDCLSTMSGGWWKVGLHRRRSHFTVAQQRVPRNRVQVLLLLNIFFPNVANTNCTGFCQNYGLFLNLIDFH